MHARIWGLNWLAQGLSLLFESRRCRGCGEVSENGQYLCANCLDFMVKTGQARTIDYEEKMVARPETVFEGAQYLGERDGILGELVEEYKYYARREMSEVLAEIIVRIYLQQARFEGQKLILTPMPTARQHIRERGLDHIDLICRKIERRDGRTERVRLLARKQDTVQVGASEELRKQQAKEAVEVDLASLGKIKGRKVILLDDVWTTGSSLLEAGRRLREAGVVRRLIDN